MNLWQWIKAAVFLRAAVNQAASAAQKENAMSKSFLASWTFWANFALIVLGAVQQMGVLTTLPEPYGPALVQIIGGINILLRFKTKDAIKLPG